MHHSEMGTVRDNNTPAKKLLRYEHNTQAHVRTAEYISRYATSDALKKFADHVLTPESIIRTFTVYAMNNDKAGYDSLRNNETAINKLGQAITFYTCKVNIEVFLKALIIKLLPRIYFVLRRRKYKA